MTLLKLHVHGGASGRYDALKERALEFAFVIHRAGKPTS